jgi:hypothetical protein
MSSKGDKVPNFVAGHAAGHTPRKAGQMAEKRDIGTGTPRARAFPTGRCPGVPNRDIGGDIHGRDRDTPGRARCVPIPPCGGSLT